MFYPYHFYLSGFTVNKETFSKPLETKKKQNPQFSTDLFQVPLYHKIKRRKNLGLNVISNYFFLLLVIRLISSSISALYPFFPSFIGVSSTSGMSVK